MPPKPSPPNPDEIIALRNSVLEELRTGNILSGLDPIDIEKFEKDDDYTARFLLHNQNDHKKAHSMAVDTLKWRKEVDANNITEESVNQVCLMRGELFVHNKDVDGCRMLVFSVQKHTKNSPDIADMKKVVIYWLERLEREGKGKWITVVFDMHNTGLKNMDMDFIQYFINIFKFYYPYVLNYILVLEMPWILNAMWKIIRSWLPPEAIEKIKFLDKKTVTNYVPPDQCLATWGGTDPYSFEFVPEIQPVLSPEMKKVTFAETRSISPSKNSDIPITKTTGEGSLIEISPAEELLFSSNRVGAIAPFTLQSRTDSLLAFKIKTTSPEKYRVKPSVGVLGGMELKKITVSITDTVQPSTLVRDKFLVVATPTTVPIDSIPDNEIFKNCPTELIEFRLRVGLEAPESLPVNGIVGNKSQSGGLDAPDGVPKAITDKLNLILDRQTNLEGQVVFARRVMFLTLIMMLGLMFFLMITSNSLTEKLLILNTAGQQGSSEL